MSPELPACLEAIRSDIRDLQRQQAQGEAVLAAIRHQIHAQEEDLILLSRLLRGENGKDSILLRLALMERLMSDFVDTAKEMKKWIQEEKTETNKGRSALIQGVVVALIATMGGVISQVLGALLKKVAGGGD